MWREKDTVKTYADGEVIVREGDPGNVMFIIVSGEVKVSKQFGAEQVELARLGRGDHFGEMSLLDKSPRSATITSVGSTRLMMLNMGYFMLKIRRDPTFAYSIMVKMCERIRSLNDSLVFALDHDTPRQIRERIAASEFVGHDRAGEADE